MIGPNSPQRLHAHALDLVPRAHRLAQRLDRYFAQHPNVSREEFLMAALEKELDARAPELGRKVWPSVRLESHQPRRWVDERRPLTEEDLRIHAWLSERLALLHREPQGWWPKVRRFLGF
jgi:hypothetical protein